MVLAHSRECTKELRSALPILSSIGAFEARTENEMPSGETAGIGGSSVLVVGSFFCGLR